MVPAHLAAEAVDASVLLPVLVVLSGLASGLLAGIGIWAYYRRRSTPYLLLAVALTLLSGKALVAVLSFAGYLSYTSHNAIEHGLDLLVVVLLVLAVVEARYPDACPIGGWVNRG